MKSIINFISARQDENGKFIVYEIEAEAEESIPHLIMESPDGEITDLVGHGSWKSLPEMSQALKFEIVSWTSEPGN